MEFSKTTPGISKHIRNQGSIVRKSAFVLEWFGDVESEQTSVDYEPIGKEKAVRNVSVITSLGRSGVG